MEQPGPDRAGLLSFENAIFVPGNENKLATSKIL